MKKPQVPTDSPPALTHNPFEKLRVPAPAPVKAPPSLAAPAPKGPPLPARAVIRYERAGRGGKEVTIIEQLALRDRDLESYLALLKKALGCGGRIEEHALVLQGDQRERIEAWLVKRGIPKVIRGS
jgi:translation initiation factor 1